MRASQALTMSCQSRVCPVRRCLAMIIDRHSALCIECAPCCGSSLLYRTAGCGKAQGDCVARITYLYSRDSSR